MYEFDSSILIFSIILTWTIGLIPPILIRYVFFRNYLSKWLSIVICAFFWLFNIFLFTALGSKSKTHTALLLIAFISYLILRQGAKSKEESLGEQPAMSVKKYAKRYGVKEKQVIELLESGEIQGKQQNGTWYVFSK